MFIVASAELKKLFSNNIELQQFISRPFNFSFIQWLDLSIRQSWKQK